MRGSQFITSFAFLLAGHIASAQDILDAYHFSNTNVQGTARSIGFGSALGSIGGDFSSLSVNPAGIGVYRNSEFSFTPSLKAASSSSQYLNVTTDENNVRFNINNLGVVFTNAPKGKRYDRHDWKAVSLGLGINRVADFNRNYAYQGINNSSSASQAFESNANIDTNNVDNLGTLGSLGYESYLLNPLVGGGYITAVPYQGGIQQLNRVEERGRINEFVISFGGNYKEKLLLGATLGIPTVKYTRTSSYSENVIASNPSNPYNFQSFTYDNTLNISGTGVNLKLGAIFKVGDFLRLGAALHTPTAYFLNETTDYGISSRIGGNSYYSSTNDYLPRYAFDYTIITPLKSVLSAAFIIRKIGFFTADYEYINYRSMRFNFRAGIDDATGSSYTYIADSYNRAIKNTYQGASNIRLGGEIKLTKYFMIRGGFGLYGNPYKNTNLNQRIDLSGGLGFRTQHFFTDLGIVNSTFQSAENAYSFDYTYVNGAQASFPVATTDHSITNIAFTVGLKF